MSLHLVRPAHEHLDAYKAALMQGWSGDSSRPEAAALEELARISADADTYLDRQVDREALGDPVTLPDGSVVARLPGLRMWLWDGEFCGVIGLRWQNGTTDLPPHCLGHIGYSVVPWKRGLGYATAALGLMLPLARAEGLAHVDITTDVGNLASQRVIVANGGQCLGTFTKPVSFGSTQGLRYRIALA